MPRVHASAFVAALTLLLVAVAPCVSAAPKVDVVVLRNGSRVIGELKSLSKSRLALGTDDMGTLRSSGTTSSR